MQRIKSLLLGVLVLLTLSAFSGRAEAWCFTDNISNGGTPYNMDWDSPDGTAHGSFPGAVYIQLHQFCGWTPSGTLSVTMRWFDSGIIYTGSSTSWNGAHAYWNIHDTQQSQWFQFACDYVRPVLWHCAMKRYDVAQSAWVSNGTVDLW
jgi:hypothetical protein